MSNQIPNQICITHMNMHQVLVGTAICWLSEDITVDNSVCLKWKFNFVQKTNENQSNKQKRLQHFSPKLHRCVQR